jgi:hypothetical protein
MSIRERTAVRARKWKEKQITKKEEENKERR